MAELIAYFSRRDENYVSGALKQLEVGNTEVVAGIIKKLTGADISRLNQRKLIPKTTMPVSRRRRQIREATRDRN